MKNMNVFYNNNNNYNNNQIFEFVNFIKKINEIN